jgi:superoxide dismutase, Cu-Zn family
MSRTAILLAATVLFGAGCSRNKPDTAIPTNGTSARVAMKDATGRPLGDLSLVQTANGVLLTGLLSNVPPGTHGIHFHTVGRCTPTFDAAGGHFNPTSRQHGYRNANGAHAGDLPNINVAADGTVRIELHTSMVNLGGGANGLFDGDGSAVMIHALADDYTTDPSGSSGARIACGEVAR